MSAVKNTREEIAVVAESLWTAAGKPEGRDLEFWLAAESQVRNGSQLVSAASSPGPSNTGFTQSGNTRLKKAKASRR